MAKSDPVIAKIEAALSQTLPAKHVATLLQHFTELREEVLTGALGRVSCGKFVECLVQILQGIGGVPVSADGHVDVSGFFEKIRKGDVSFPDQTLRSPLREVALSIYAMRSKRGMAHSSGIEPNITDLSQALHSTQWIIAELLRAQASLSIDDANAMMRFLSQPVVAAVESFDVHKTVLDTKLTAPQELLVLLRSYYPNAVPESQIRLDMKRRKRDTIRVAVVRLYKSKLIERNGEMLVLTRTGLAASEQILPR